MFILKYTFTVPQFNIKKIKTTTYKLHKVRLSCVTVHSVLLIQLIAVCFNCIYKIGHNVLLLHWN